jgi:hypothetical protein
MEHAIAQAKAANRILDSAGPALSLAPPRLSAVVGAASQRGLPHPLHRAARRQAADTPLKDVLRASAGRGLCRDNHPRANDQAHLPL